MVLQAIVDSNAQSSVVQVSQDGLVTCELVAGAVTQGSDEGNSNSGPTRVSNMMMHVSCLCAFACSLMVKGWIALVVFE